MLLPFRAPVGVEAGLSLGGALAEFELLGVELGELAHQLIAAAHARLGEDAYAGRLDEQAHPASVVVHALA